MGITKVHGSRYLDSSNRNFELGYYDSDFIQAWYKKGIILDSVNHRELVEGIEHNMKSYKIHKGIYVVDGCVIDTLDFLEHNEEREKDKFRGSQLVLRIVSDSKRRIKKVAYNLDLPYDRQKILPFLGEPISQPGLLVG